MTDGGISVPARAALGGRATGRENLRSSRTFRPSFLSSLRRRCRRRRRRATHPPKQPPAMPPASQLASLWQMVSATAGSGEWTWTRGKGRADPMGLHGHYLPTILPTYRDRRRRRRRRRGREDQPTRWSSSSAARNMDGPFLSIVHTSSPEGKEGRTNSSWVKKDGLLARPSNTKPIV